MLEALIQDGTHDAVLAIFSRQDEDATARINFILLRHRLLVPEIPSLTSQHDSATFIAMVRFRCHHLCTLRSYVHLPLSNALQTMMHTALKANCFRFLIRIRCEVIRFPSFLPHQSLKALAVPLLRRRPRQQQCPLVPFSSSY